MAADEPNEQSAEETARKQAERAKAAEYRAAAKQRREADPELMEKWLAGKREEAKRYHQRKKAKQQRAAKDRERVEAWRRANPERVAQRQREWTENNRDRVRKSGLDYFYRHHEERLEAMRDSNAVRRSDPAWREKQRQWRIDHREELNARQRERRSTPEGREKHLTYQREYRQREKRRRELGLPPRPRHHATLNERKRNEEAASEFFARLRSPAEMRIILEEGFGMGDRQTASPSAWRPSAATATALTAERDAERLADQLLASKRGDLLREEVRMDSVARQLRGLPPYSDLDLETQRRARIIVAAGTQDYEAATDLLRTRRQAAQRGPVTAPTRRSPGSREHEHRSGMPSAHSLSR